MIRLRSLMIHHSSDVVTLSEPGKWKDLADYTIILELLAVRFTPK